mgnify:FL=1
MKQFDRVYAKIYLDRIEKNMEAMQRNLTAGTMIIGVVKADGYGHGAVAVAKTINRFVSAFATATVEEALQLRKHGVKKGILVLGAVPPGRFDVLIQEGIRPSIFHLAQAQLLSERAVSMGKTAKIHVAVDTGMSRIGVDPTVESARVVKEMSMLPGIEIEGMFTHFARADEADKTSAEKQLRKFKTFIHMVHDLGVTIPICHCSNSAGIMDMREANLDAVRAGITIYGLYPSDEVKKSAVPVEPAMELKSFLTNIKEIEPGTEVSYGGTFRAESFVRVGTVSIGYADGYPRNLSGCGHVLVCKKRAPVLGRICMDQLMIDLTEIPEAKEWDEVTLIGRDGREEITMEEIALKSGGFHYELPCLIGKRVPRLYVYQGRTIGTFTCEDGEYEGF